MDKTVTAHDARNRVRCNAPFSVRLARYLCKVEKSSQGTKLVIFEGCHEFPSEYIYNESAIEQTIFPYVGLDFQTALLPAY